MDWGFCDNLGVFGVRWQMWDGGMGGDFFKLHLKLRKNTFTWLIEIWGVRRKRVSRICKFIKRHERL